jgi:hypothetical protein
LVIMEEKLAETKSVWFRKVAPHKLRVCLNEAAHWSHSYAR